MENNIRICEKCKKTFTVDNRKEIRTENRRVLCNECLSTMTKEDKLKFYEERRIKKEGEARECLNCGKIFYVKSKKVTTSGRKRLFCDECVKTLTNYQKKKIKMEKDPEYHEKVKADKRASHKRNIVHNMWKRAHDRALKYNLEFNIEESDIIIPEICPLLNIPIICGDKDDYENSPSLDRIDNHKGYVKNNVWVISKKANSMKNSASHSELDTFCKNIIRYSLNTTEKESSELQDKEPVS